MRFISYLKLLLVKMATDKKIADMKKMEVKELNKRKSGEAFEVILKPADEDAIQNSLKSIPPKKESSIDQIQMKMQAAEERRRALQDAVVNQVKAEDEKVLKVKQKKAEASTIFASSAQEKLKNKMSLYEENYESVLQAKIEKFRAMNIKPDELKEKIQKEIDDLRVQRGEHIQQKLSKSELLRQQQLQSVREKQLEKENHAQQVRQNKQKHASGDSNEADTATA